MIKKSISIILVIFLGLIFMAPHVFAADHDDLLDSLGSSEPQLEVKTVEKPEININNANLVKKSIQIKDENGNVKTIEVIIPAFLLPAEIIKKVSSLPLPKSLTSLIAEKISQSKTLKNITETLRRMPAPSKALPLVKDAREIIEKRIREEK